MFVLLLTLLGCDAENCSHYPMGSCKDAQICCSSAECSYTAAGEEFPCEGTDCALAAEDFTSYCSLADTGI